MINTEYANLYKSKTIGENLLLWYYLKTEVMYTVDSYFKIVVLSKELHYRIYNTHRSSLWFL